MKLILDDSRYLREPINIISELVNEVKFKLHKDRIELIAMDPANVAMVVLNILSPSFSEYTVNGEEIAVNLDNLKNILKRAKPSDSVILELKDNKLQIDFKGESNRSFTLALIDLHTQTQKVPELDFDAKIKTNTLIFNEAIEDMSVVSDSVNFIIKDNNFIMNTEGNFSNAHSEMQNNKETSVDAKESNIKSKYSLEYLKKIAKGSKLSNDVFIQFSKDYPLKVDYTIKDKVSLSFLLAPRVSND
ncbi:MAG: proliferating cell nuclear antigen (pcna) [Candidatus Nanoarchaeia archaeon]|nr:proliferating cell nuclear antigen (pcna) [Candidatus Nanoarchaeia archaeon]MDD5587663.1 proliferating cell nuclear antigen (pcna) [Candidatus Nanoarchaeia archaeon]